MSGGDGDSRASLAAPPTVNADGDFVVPGAGPRADAADLSRHHGTIVSGVVWQGALRWLAQVLSWTATIVVARRLSPDDYGVAGTAGVIVGLMSLVTDAGIGRALVLRRERDAGLLAQAHAASLGVGVLLCAVMLLAAYPIGSFYGDTRIAPVVLLLAVVPILSGFNTVPQAILQQNLEYRRLATVDFARAIVQASVVLGCTVGGMRYWSLAVGLLAGHVAAVLVGITYRRIRPARPSIAAITPTLRYAGHLVVGTLAWFTYSNADFVVVGRVVGIAALGYYQFAWNIAQLPGEKLGNVLQAVVGPFFGSIGDDQHALRHYFLLLSEILIAVLFPVLCGFALVSPIAVPLFFGNQWAVAVPLVQLLVVCAAIGSIAQLSHHVLGATGQAAVAARLNLVAMVSLPVLFWAGASVGGSMAVAIVWVFAQPLLIGYPLYRMRETIDLTITQYLRELQAPLVCTALMAAVVVSLRQLMGGSIPPLGQLGILITSGAAVYTAAYVLLFRKRVSAILAVWRARGDV